MEDIKQLGGLEEGSSQRRIVYDSEYTSPTLQAAMGAGGGNVPLVVENKKVIELNKDIKHQQDLVMDENGLCRTICVDSHGSTPHLLKTLTCEKVGEVEAVIGSMQENAMVGNGDYSPSLTSAMGMGGGQIPMVVEKSNVTAVNPMDDGTCRTIKGQYHFSTIQNFENQCSFGATGVVESQIVAMRGRNPENPSDRTKGIELEQKLEPNSQGICNTLTTVQKDNMVLEKSVVAIDEQNKCIRTDTFGTLTTDGSSPKHNNRVGEIKKIKIKQATKQGFIECEIGGVFCSEYPTSELRRGRVIENGQISPTLTTESIPDRIELGNPDFYNFLYEIDGEIYLIRIRKLIPLECWRLMGFTDEDFKKAEKVNSNTQLYKQAGNSIVCDCLEAIFSQMNIEGVKPWNEKIKETEV